MRKYSIGAVLLDKDDPSKVIGRTREPLLAAKDQDREGYVPNVVYSCGAVRHGDTLFLPYGIADSSIVSPSYPSGNCSPPCRPGPAARSRRWAGETVFRKNVRKVGENRLTGVGVMVRGRVTAATDRMVWLAATPDRSDDLASWKGSGWSFV